MNKPKARKNDIVIQKLEDETLVYDTNENKAFCLNETSALVWSLCDGKRTALNISDEMSRRFKTHVTEEFVGLALDQFSKDNLLENSEQAYFIGISRREMIRKVGATSVVTLPIVSSLVAPEAASAMSCASLNSSCSGSSECCSNSCTATTGASTGPSCCVSPTNNVSPTTALIFSPSPSTSQFCFPSAGSCDARASTDCCSGTANSFSNGACPFSFQVFCICS